MSLSSLGANISGPRLKVLSSYGTDSASNTQRIDWARDWFSLRGLRIRFTDVQRKIISYLPVEGDLDVGVGSHIDVCGSVGCSM